MHAFGNQLNECLVRKGTAHKLIYPWENSVKPTLHEQRRTFPEAKISDLFTFPYGSSAFIKGTDADAWNSFAQG